MNLLKRITPTNLASEQARFLADPTKNPQFTYETPIDPAELKQYGQPNEAYLALAEQIVKKAYRHRNEADLVALEGSTCTQSQVEKTTEAFLRLHQLEKRFEMVFSQSFISRTSISADTIKFRLPIDFRKEGLLGALYHEIGTHALRRINYEQQPWYKKKKHFGFQSYLQTEEGLASLHTLIPKSFQLAHSAALRYIVTAWSQQESFVGVWNKLSQYVQDEQRRWLIVLRQKRGMTDTSQPGGFTKDAMYFAGMVEVWNWLNEHDFNPSDLYWGKMALADIEKAKQMQPNFTPALPVFYLSSPEKYAQALKKIGEENFFSQR